MTGLRERVLTGATKATDRCMWMASSILASDIAIQAMASERPFATIAAGIAAQVALRVFKYETTTRNEQYQAAPDTDAQRYARHQRG